MAQLQRVLVGIHLLITPSTDVAHVKLSELKEAKEVSTCESNLP
jgi:hypothetical protein